MAWTERYCSVDGGGTSDGTSEANAWTLAEAITNAVAGHRVNVLAGTYTLAAANTMAVSGTPPLPIHWRGYSSTIGDLDTATDHTTFPHFDYGGASSRLIVQGSYNWLSNIRVTAENTSSGTAAVFWSGSTGRLFHNHIVGEAADADGHALVMSSTSDRTLVYSNYLQSTTTAVSCLELAGSAHTSLVAGNYISGGNIGLTIDSITTCQNNIIVSPNTIGITVNVSSVNVSNNTIYNTGGAGIRIGAADLGNAVVNNIFSVIGSYAVSHTDAGDDSTLVMNNTYHSITSGQLENIDEQFNAITLTESPFVNVGAGDFTPISAARVPGFPTRIGLASTLTYPGIGAVQRADPAGGAPLISTRRNTLIGR